MALELATSNHHKSHGHAQIFQVETAKSWETQKNSELKRLNFDRVRSTFDKLLGDSKFKTTILLSCHLKCPGDL